MRPRIFIKSSSTACFRINTAQKTAYRNPAFEFIGLSAGRNKTVRIMAAASLRTPETEGWRSAGIPSDGPLYANGFDGEWRRIE